MSNNKDLLKEVGHEYVIYKEKYFEDSAETLSNGCLTI